eukprot:gene7522-9815_t
MLHRCPELCAYIARVGCVACVACVGRLCARTRSCTQHKQQPDKTSRSLEAVGNITTSFRDHRSRRPLLLLLPNCHQLCNSRCLWLVDPATTNQQLPPPHHHRRRRAGERHGLHPQPEPPPPPPPPPSTPVECAVPPQLHLKQYSTIGEDYETHRNISACCSAA